jgi:hypothetical protein
LSASIAFSRRVFLTLLGFAATFGSRAGAVSAMEAVATRPDNELVVVRGWVLRRDEIDRLPTP